VTQTHRPIRSYVLRQGRVSNAQRKAHETLLPRFGVPYAPAEVDLDAVFGRPAPRVLEIGSAMGETTALINVRVVQHDAVEVLEHMIAPGALDGAHIFFPDPWPKKRHHKRRLIQSGFVRLLASRMKPGGYVHVATDWHEYAQQVLEVLSAEPALENTADGFAPRPDYRPLTKFEQRGLDLGHGVWDVVFRRVITRSSATK
jgi:tRNA (guanine-N7-)-methyltransferase